MQYVYYIMGTTKFFSGMKGDLSDQLKKKKKVRREECQRTCFVKDRIFFYLGLDDSGCKSIKLNYLKNVEKRFTKDF